MWHSPRGRRGCRRRRRARWRSNADTRSARSCSCPDGAQLDRHTQALKGSPDQLPTGLNPGSTYLSALVTKHRPPQKLFIVHEFHLSEVPYGRTSRPSQA